MILAQWVVNVGRRSAMSRIAHLLCELYVRLELIGLAGVFGAVCLGLFFGSHYLVGLAGWEEIMLLVAGVALIGVEMFVLPGFGVAGVAAVQEEMPGGPRISIPYLAAVAIISSGAGGCRDGGGRVRVAAGSERVRMKPSKPAGSVTRRNRAWSEVMLKVWGTSRGP